MGGGCLKLKYQGTKLDRAKQKWILLSETKVYIAKLQLVWPSVPKFVLKESKVEIH